jgi:hypothetical protein
VVTGRPPCPDREVQARVVIDAIVSNKTFRNATFPPKWKLLQSWFQQIDLFLQIIQIIRRYTALHFWVCRRGNGILPPGGSNCPSLRRVPPVVLGWTSFLTSRCPRALNRQINFCVRGAWEKRGHVILEKRSAVPTAVESSVSEMPRPYRGRRTPLGRGPTGRTPHC